MKLELVDKSEYPEEKPSTNQTGTRQADEPYNGPERRVAQRRQGRDRRAEVRFDMNKPERRSGKDRRAPKSAWDKDRYDLF